MGKPKQKTKARVKHIAFNLIQLYAKRRLDKGFQFAPDSYLQKELESSFIYEDTPDQITATADVKADMEKTNARWTDWSVVTLVSERQKLPFVQLLKRWIMENKLRFCANNHFSVSTLPNIFRTFERYAGYRKLFEPI